MMDIDICRQCRHGYIEINGCFGGFLYQCGKHCVDIELVGIRDRVGLELKLMKNGRSADGRASYGTVAFERIGRAFPDEHREFMRNVKRKDVWLTCPYYECHCLKKWN